MEPLKSPVLNQEHDDHDFKSTVDSAPSTARSYDCTFCKRGFTNAQALGGHMNIHRKDKGVVVVKAKPRSYRRHQETARPSSQSNYGNLRYYPEILTRTDHLHQRQFGFFRPGGEHLVHHPAYLPLLPNPNFQIGNLYGVPVWRAEVAVDTNLSLGIGVDGEPRGKDKDAEIDLELRLGHER